MRKRVLALLLALGTALGLTLTFGVGTASATMPGLQQIWVSGSSWSGVYTNFPNNCGSWTVPVGATWGEGVSNPGCGGVSGNSEPGYIWLGAGWCVTQNIIFHDNNQMTGDNYAWGGGSGGWIQVWNDGAAQTSPSGYTTKVAAWYGSWCPTTGSAGKTWTP